MRGNNQVGNTGGGSLTAKLARLWQSRNTRAVVTLLLLAAATMPQAHAGIFDTLGANLATPICEFLDSPIITVVLAVAFIIAGFGAILMKEKGIVAIIIGVLAIGLFLMALPATLMQFGFNPLGC